MSDTKFTPGPWDEFHNIDGEYCVSMGTHSDSPYCYQPKHLWKCEWTIDDSEEECDTEAEANMSLIAAAPDMYKALEEMIESMESDFAPGYGSEWHIKAIRALGKAGGE